MEEENNIEFDVRLTKQLETHPEVLCVRTHVSTDSGIYYCVWATEISHTHRMEACIQASLHSKRTIAKILNLRTNTEEKIIVQQTEEFLKKLIK